MQILKNSSPAQQHGGCIIGQRRGSGVGDDRREKLFHLILAGPALLHSGDDAADFELGAKLFAFGVLAFAELLDDAVAHDQCPIRA